MRQAGIAMSAFDIAWSILKQSNDAGAGQPFPGTDTYKDWRFMSDEEKEAARKREEEQREIYERSTGNWRSAWERSLDNRYKRIQAQIDAEKKRKPVPRKQSQGDENDPV